MYDIRDVFDQAIAVTGRIAAAGHYRGLVREAEAIDARRCGNCEHWMASRYCPRETNVNGWNRGPSGDATACDKFLIKPYVVQLKVKRLAEAEAFATGNGLK